MTLTVERPTPPPAAGSPRRRGHAAAVLVSTSLVALLLAVSGSAFSGDEHRDPRASVVDVGFSQDMAAHHNQAIAMTNAIRGRVHGELAVIADGISAKQLFELGQFQGWLALWGEPVAAGEPMHWMELHPHPMPGVISSAELVELQRAQGPHLHRLFLELMIRHHRGGVVMARRAAQQAALEPVRGLAARIVLDQTAETERLAHLLAAIPQRRKS